MPFAARQSSSIVTLLIDVDREGLRELIAWVREMWSGRKSWLSDYSGVSLQSGLRVELECVLHDGGLMKTGETEFVWSAQRTAGWRSSKSWN
jgi:hypothetical protein